MAVASIERYWQNEQVTFQDFKGSFIAGFLDILKNYDIHNHNEGVAYLMMFGVETGVFPFTRTETNSMKKLTSKHDNGKTNIPGWLYFKSDLNPGEKTIIERHAWDSVAIDQAQGNTLTLPEQVVMVNHQSYGPKYAPGNIRGLYDINQTRWQKLLPFRDAIFIADVLRSATEERVFRGDIIPQLEITTVLASEAEKFTPEIRLEGRDLTPLISEAYRRVAAGELIFSTAIHRLAGALLRQFN